MLQDDTLPLDSLLAAIARFSLQTSARNQFFGTVLERDQQQVQQHLSILLADGHTRIQAALTQQSADRLQLTGGKDVLALIKAPWVTITPQTASTPEHDNVLPGRISHLQPGQTQSEVLVTLEGGEVVCATLSNDEVTQQGLQPEMAVYASFNADQVIIATLC
ncbi:hypothetical protein DaDZ19_27850 [Dickeya ananatis]